MKLLIDEMYPRAIAERLRKAGYDVVSVTENAEMVGLDDSAVCDLAVSSKRAVVTENAADFLRIAKQRTAAGEPVPTLVITSNRSFPRHSRSFLGRAVHALKSFCDEHEEPDPQGGGVHWLRPMG